MELPQRLGVDSARLDLCVAWPKSRERMQIDVEIHLSSMKLNAQILKVNILLG